MITFFVALLPQFVKPERGSLAIQGLMLGTTLALLAMVWIGAIAFVVGRFRKAVASNPIFLKVANRVAAVTFVGLAYRLAFANRR